jgi:omega-amidase
MRITVALAQMAIVLDRPDLNQDTARSMATQAAAQGADLLVLPELWPTGYNLVQAGEYATSLDRGAFATMADLARAHQMHVVGTALEASPGGPPFNSAVLYGPDGRRLAVYRKVHLFPPMGELKYMTRGTSLPTFDLPWGRTALAICYDLRFPEMWRRFTAAGAQIIIISAEWPVSRLEHWRLLLRARAVENQIFVVGCNRAGQDTDGEFGGHSAAVDPMGQVLVEGGLEPGLFVATLDLDEVTTIRHRFPFLKDRQPEVYG